MPQTEIKTTCDQLRKSIDLNAKTLLSIKQDPLMTGSPGASEVPHVDIGEAHANLMLAYRHLEDARMRIGKLLQALDGGTSIYDRGA